MPMLPYEENGWIKKNPHVVILGAGSSKAACRNGDKNGKPLPLMNDMTQLLGLATIYQHHGFKPTSTNFEDTYQEICDVGKNDLRIEIEDKVWQFFNKLELPNELTLYDILVLSLREKDVIATFNWDPFLAQAWRRNRDWLWDSGVNPAEYLPQVLFLHGNVEVGYCDCDEKLVYGFLRDPHRCQICKQPLKPTPLLYPVREKNYNTGPSIHLQWKALGKAIELAYLLTVFGYGAPVSDVEAIGLMKAAWDENQTQALSTTEIINVESQKILRRKWAPFFYRPSPHYSINRTLFHSRIALYPRRSCESLWHSTMESKPFHDRLISRRWRSLRWFRSWIGKTFDLGPRYD